MLNPKLTILLALLCLVATGARPLRADVTPVPLTSSQVGPNPYKFNGILMADDGYFGAQGSGSVVQHSNVVLSAAHGV